MSSRLARVVAAALLWLAAAPARREPQLIPWAWERREDLRFLGSHATVAFYAGILTLDGDRVRIEPRRNPLLLVNGVHRIAVIRIETRRPSLTRAQLASTIDAVRFLYRNAEELQIDFDAGRSERAFYRDLLIALHEQIGSRLTITALASWCLDDRWMTDLPIDEAVPMLFRMGGDQRSIHDRLTTIDHFPDPRCRTSIGISTDEPLAHMPRAGRVWVFNPEPWTEKAWREMRKHVAK